MEIPNIVISKFINWSKPPFNADTNIDKRFVFAFLLALTEEDKLMVNDIQAEVMDFVQGKNEFYFAMLTVLYVLNLIFVLF